MTLRAYIKDKSIGRGRDGFKLSLQHRGKGTLSKSQVKKANPNMYGVINRIISDKWWDEV